MGLRCRGRKLHKVSRTHVIMKGTAWVAARFSLITLIGLFPVQTRAGDERVERAGQAIDAAGMLGHIKTLASDDFEGREPASAGEEKTVDYLTGQFKKLGLKPGNPNGSFIQEV